MAKIDLRTVDSIERLAELIRQRENKWAKMVERCAFDSELGPAGIDALANRKIYFVSEENSAELRADIRKYRERWSELREMDPWNYPVNKRGGPDPFIPKVILWPLWITVTYRKAPRLIKTSMDKIPEQTVKRFKEKLAEVGIHKKTDYAVYERKSSGLEVRFTYQQDETLVMKPQSLRKWLVVITKDEVAIPIDWNDCLEKKDSKSRVGQPKTKYLSTRTHTKLGVQYHLRLINQ